MENPFDIINQRFDQVIAILSQMSLNQSTPDEEQIMNADEAATFMKISKSALYDNISSIPHSKKFGKLYFFKSQLLDFLKGELPITDKPVKPGIRQTRRTRKK